MHIVIIGGSFGGLNVAYHLRRLLPHNSHEITVISVEPRFIFVPSLPWVTMGSKSIDDISFALRGPLNSKGINFTELLTITPAQFALIKANKTFPPQTIRAAEFARQDANPAGGN